MLQEHGTSAKTNRFTSRRKIRFMICACKSWKNSTSGKIPMTRAMPDTKTRTDSPGYWIRRQHDVVLRRPDVSDDRGRPRPQYWRPHGLYPAEASLFDGRLARH